MRNAVFVVLLGACALFSLTSSSANAQGFHLSADMGVSKFFNDGPTGFGMNLYPGYAFGAGSGLVLEGQLGFHRGAHDVHHHDRDEFPFGHRKTAAIYVPIQAGARYIFDAGVVKPFFAVHMGAARAGACLGNFCGHDVRFGMNAGAGAEFAINEMIAVGAAGWFHNIFDEDHSLQLVNFGAHASFWF